MISPAFDHAVRRVEVGTLANEYLHWAIGTGRFAGLRRGRLDMDIPRTLTVDGLQNSGDHAGVNDCSLAVRRNEQVALMKMSHRDRDDGARHAPARAARGEEQQQAKHRLTILPP